MHIAVIGGSVAGLVTGLLLARAGHDVEVFDGDDLDAAPDAESAAGTAFRPGAPQLVHAHGYHPPAVDLLRERLPDVFEALHAAGAVTAPLSDRMPPTLADRSTWPGDERFSLLLVRRSTLDWVLRRAAAAAPGLRLRGGVTVTGLVADPGSPPTVRGVRTAQGDRAADLVVDASGRRSGAERWLVECGATRPGYVFGECGAAYYTRHFRVRPGSCLPVQENRFVLAHLPYFTLISVVGDQDTRAISIAPLVEDGPMRALRDPATHSAVARMVPSCDAWLDALEPISDVHVMGGLHNTMRRLVVDGRPVVLGLHAVGDAVCTTNPVGGRGVSLAFGLAGDLADVLAEHPGDRCAQSVAMDDAIGRKIQPWYEIQASSDAQRLESIRCALRGEVQPVGAGAGGGITMNELRAAATVDPDLFRSLAWVLSMLRTPSEVLADPEVQERVRKVQRCGAVVPPPPAHSRAELLEVVQRSA